MGLYWNHFLVPSQPEFMPEPRQVAAFYDALVELGSAPLQAKFQLAILTGESSTIPIPGREPMVVNKRKRSFFQSASEIPEQLNGLDDYYIAMFGEGPATRPPFEVFGFKDKTTEEIKFTGKYGYQVSCDLREVVIATTEKEFGRPCPPGNRVGVFQNPRTEAMIHVPNTACSRFLVKLVVGKFLWPKIENSFDLLDREILTAATGSFGLQFAQAGIYT